MKHTDVTWGYYLIHWMVSGLAVYLTSRVVRGFEVSGFFSACFAAIAIALANMFIWPVLFFLTLPINILSLGIFTLVVNGAVLKICAALMPGFKINGWLPAIFGSLVLAFLNMLLHYVI